MMAGAQGVAMKYRNNRCPECSGVAHHAWVRGADFLLRQEPDEDEDDEDEDDGKEEEDEDDTESTDDGYSE
jgi:hypothetical protein